MDPHPGWDSARWSRWRRTGASRLSMLHAGRWCMFYTIAQMHGCRATRTGKLKGEHSWSMRVQAASSFLAFALEWRCWNGCTNRATRHGEGLKYESRT